MKMPEPIIEPITSMVALVRPSPFTNSFSLEPAVTALSSVANEPRSVLEVWTSVRKVHDTRARKNLHQQPQEFFSYFGRRTQKVGNHRDGIGSSFDNRTRIRASDAANRDQRFLGSGPCGPQSIESNHRDRDFAWRRWRTPAQRQCSQPGPHRPAVTARECESRHRGLVVGPITVRAPSGERSSWPTCTPSYPAAMQMSARSFMMSVHRCRRAPGESRAHGSASRAWCPLYCGIG